MNHLVKVLLVVSFNLIGFLTLVNSQTITNVEPTRVTWESKVVISGTGFTANMITDEKLSIEGISIKNRTLVNSETITFEINETSRNDDATEDINPFGPDPNDRTNKVMTFNGTATAITFDFIAPTIRVHRKIGTATNPIDQITEIFTNMDGFSRFSSKDDIIDDKHELLAFTYKGITYSTGVDDQVLTENSIAFVPQEYKAYSTNGVEGTTNSNHYLAAADSSDGLMGGLESDGTPASNYPELSGLLIYDTLIDGVNGLELGTGITNLNQNNTIRFFSGNGQVGALGNDIPDLVLTQIAAAGAWDIYYYADINGNVVGRPIRLFIENAQSKNEPLATNNWDFYRYQQNVSFDAAAPGIKALGNDATRPLRMMAFRLEEFAIDATNIADINNINMSAGGRADLAFMAYNKSAFAIRSPVISNRPPSRYICELPSADIVTFEVGVTIDGEENNPGYIPTPDEALSYQWYKYNSELTGEIDKYLQFNGVGSSDLGTYNVIVSNTYGAVIVPVALNEGGTPAFWNGSSWQLPPGFGSGPGEIVILDKERSLRFNADYTLPGALEGCDCTVAAGNDVIIPSGSSLKLFGKITVEDLIPASIDIDGNLIDEIPAGTFYLQNGASLVQINDVSTNQNIGEIVMDRDASVINDFEFIYWSSPVDGFDIDDIPNNASYLWDTRAPNGNGTEGNWVAYNGSMQKGKGYIGRVESANDFTSVFKGLPNNGIISVAIAQTGDILDNDNNTLPLEDRHWNLLGNPYPSALSAEKFYTENTNLEGAVYIWDSNTSSLNNSNTSPFYENFVISYSDSYISYNNMGSVPANSFDGNIASGQGFFVKANSSGTVEFNNTMRYGALEVILPNDEFKRSGNVEPNQSTEQENAKLWMSLVNEDNEASTLLIGYDMNATNGKDRLYDAFANRGQGELAVYSLLDNNKMVIQGRAMPFNNQDQVVLGVQIPESGIYHLGLDQLEGALFLDEETPIILEDVFTGTFHDLRESPYSFSVQTGTYNDRFVLRYDANLLNLEGVVSHNTYAFIKEKTLKVKSKIQINELKVYDINGQSIMQIKTSGSTNAIETDFNFSRGTYIAVITLEGNTSISTKLIN